MKKGQKKPDGKTVRKFFRFSRKDWNRIVGLAKIYAGGNATKWLTHGGLTAERKHLK